MFRLRISILAAILVELVMAQACRDNFADIKWVKRQGEAKEISVTTDDTVYVVSSKRAPAGYFIYRWTGEFWTLFPSKGAIRMAVNGTTPWIIDA
jgi:hypothetical protein